MTEKTKDIIELHKQGNSTQEIADMLKMKKNSIIQRLRYYNKLRKSPGVEMEKTVCNWLSKNGFKVKRMRGDWYYDCLVDGEKVDIKYSRKNKNGRYFFQINHKESKSKNNHRIDCYLLVVDDGFDKDLYRLSAKETLNLKRTLAFFVGRTKYPLEYISTLA